MNRETEHVISSCEPSLYVFLSGEMLQNSYITIFEVRREGEVFGKEKD